MATTTKAESYVDTDTSSDEVLLAATNHDIEVLKTLLKKDPTLAKVQDADTGFSPLHAAIASCEADEGEEEEGAGEGGVNGEGDAVNNEALDEDGAL
ncbi:Arginine N-methyltransferase 2, partial [Friedmanniomyces endolithicus]